MVVGHVRRNEKGRRAAITPVDNQMRLINSDAIAMTLPYPVKSGYIGLLTVQPEQEGEFQPIQLPELSEGPHFWYAVQWFMFTADRCRGNRGFHTHRSASPARRTRGCHPNPR